MREPEAEGVPHERSPPPRVSVLRPREPASEEVHDEVPLVVREEGALSRRLPRDSELAAGDAYESTPGFAMEGAGRRGVSVRVGDTPTRTDPFSRPSPSRLSVGAVAELANAAPATADPVAADGVGVDAISPPRPSSRLVPRSRVPSGDRTVRVARDPPLTPPAGPAGAPSLLAEATAGGCTSSLRAATPAVSARARALSRTEPAGAPEKAVREGAPPPGSARGTDARVASLDPE